MRAQRRTIHRVRSIARALTLGALVILSGSCVDTTSARGVPAVEAVVVRVVSTSSGQQVAGPLQQVEVQIITPPSTGARELLYWGGAGQPQSRGSLLREGDHVILTRLPSQPASDPHQIVSVVRTPVVAWLLVALAVGVFAAARWKGLAALAGLALSGAVFFAVVIRSILRGDDPLPATLVASLLILIVTVYAVHGRNKKSSVALAGAVGSLAVVVVAAVAVSTLARIGGTAGFGADIAQLPALRGRIDLTDLALAGMILGGLGALVDMAVGQSSATFELAAVDPTLRGRRLYRRALNVGTDHIGALVNTLGFAYFAGALPLLVLLAARGDALAIAANDEGIVTALLAIAVACLGLVAAVPLTSGIAVVVLQRSEAIHAS
jgi:uncharacterized membrane protein